MASIARWRDVQKAAMVTESAKAIMLWNGFACAGLAGSGLDVTFHWSKTVLIVGTMIKVKLAAAFMHHIFQKGHVGLSCQRRRREVFMAQPYLRKVF